MIIQHVCQSAPFLSCHLGLVNCDQGTVSLVIALALENAQDPVSGLAVAPVLALESAQDLVNSLVTAVLALERNLGQD